MQKDVEACNRGKMKGKEKKENKEAKTSWNKEFLSVCHNFPVKYKKRDIRKLIIEKW